VELGQLNTVFFVDVSYNELRTLPAAISAMTSLQTLMVNNNQLRTLPPELGKMENLTSLLIYDNPQLNIPDTIDPGDTEAIKQYLRQQSLYYLMRFALIGGVSIGGIAVFIIGMRFWRNRGERKKKKRG
jgi:Leucine-rich repeat (LRR) protein